MQRKVSKSHNKFENPFKIRVKYKKGNFQWSKNCSRKIYQKVSFSCKMIKQLNAVNLLELWSPLRLQKGVEMLNLYCLKQFSQFLYPLLSHHFFQVKKCGLKMYLKVFWESTQAFPTLINLKTQRCYSAVLVNCMVKQ